MRFLLTLIAVAGLAGAVQAAEDTASQGPSELVEEVANRMLADLDANREEYRKDPTKIGALVEKNLLPHFDIDYAARLVLGKHWRNATPEQRDRFVKAFYQSLLRNYGSALADFTGDRLKVLPTKVAPDADRATVRTEVRRSNGERVPVNYSMRKTPEGWKAWDVVIEGISYVKSFREDFGAEIDARGLDAVIDRLEKGATPAAIAEKSSEKS
ncbi:MAG TPA: ABC transporter substrate-binding protein [Steroidobacteraceae bacterium]